MPRIISPPVGEPSGPVTPRLMTLTLFKTVHESPTDRNGDILVSLRMYSKYARLSIRRADWIAADEDRRHEILDQVCRDREGEAWTVYASVFDIPTVES